MPRMNGIEFLREMRKRRISIPVLVVSTIAKEGAKETIQALELGAFDFVTKPDSLSDAKGGKFGDNVKNRLYAAMEISEETAAKPAPAAKKKKPVMPVLKSVTEEDIKKFEKQEKNREDSHAHHMELKFSGPKIPHSKGPLGVGAKKLVALACSTGGPKALQYVIPFLPANLDAPVLIVQHMPEDFTKSLSLRLDELSRIDVTEAEDGEVIRKGKVYLAKGGRQMRLLEKGKNSHCISVTDEASRGGLKPCADIMYESLLKSSFDEITCVVLTGMGADGTKGILQLEQTNQIYVIAQDKPTSTVYGMPKAVYEAGAVDEVVALKGIADAITKHVGVH